MTYMLGMGEYQTDTYGLQNNAMAWVLFIMATMVLQLIFMNIIIAIMGETFGRVVETLDTVALKEKVGICHDHIWIVDIDKVFANQTYVFVV